jgi:glycosyltransferase involved in cell wall biosynthesis
MKTILHVIDTTGPGGAETVFIDLASRLQKDRFRSLAVIRGKGWVYEELQRRGITPFLLDAKGSFNWRFLRALYRIIRQEHVDLVQSHLLGSNVYCAMAGWLARVPVVATFHGSVDIGARERLKGLKFAVINRGARAVIAVTDSLRDDLLNRTTLRRDRLRVIYNGIDTARFQQPKADRLRRKYGWPDTVIVIGSLGNIRPAKGYDILLQTAARLAKESDNCRFVIAGQGKGPLFDELLALRRELGLEEVVQFLGFLDDPAEFLANLDLFLSSSVSEGLPLSAIQAMVSGVPVVATRVGGYVGLVDDRVTGWLVDSGNPAALAEGIRAVAADAELRTSLATAASRYAIDTFDIQVMLNAYVRQYEELLGVE